MNRKTEKLYMVNPVGLPDAAEGFMGCLSPEEPYYSPTIDPKCSTEKHARLLNEIINIFPSYISRLLVPEVAAPIGTGEDLEKDQEEALTRTLKTMSEQVNLELIEKGLSLWQKEVLFNKGDKYLTDVSGGLLEIGNKISMACLKELYGETCVKNQDFKIEEMQFPFPSEVVSETDLDNLYKKYDLHVDKMYRNIDPFLREKKDPFLYWQAAKFFLDRLHEAGVGRLHKLKSLENIFVHARNAADGDIPLKIYFEIEFRWLTDTLFPKTLDRLEERLNASPGSNPVQHAVTWSRLWIYRFNDVLTAHDGDIRKKKMAEMEKKLSNFLNIRWQKNRELSSWHNEVLYHLDAVDALVTGWASPSGDLTQILLNGNCDSVVDLKPVKQKIDELQYWARFAENISGSEAYRYPDIWDKIAKIHIAADVKSCMASGLFRKAFKNMEVLSRFNNTKAFWEAIKELNLLAPWLINEKGIVKWDDVEGGKESNSAYDRTLSLFLNGKNPLREMLFIEAAGIACSFAGPWISVGCSLSAKKIMQGFLKANPDAQTLLDESEATGLSIVGESEADSMRSADNINWGFVAVGQRLNAKMNRMVLSMGRGALSHLTGFVIDGGFKKYLSTALSKKTWQQLASSAADAVNPSNLFHGVVNKWEAFQKKALEKGLLSLTDDGAKIVIGKGKEYFGLLYEHYGRTVRLGTGTVLASGDYLSDGDINSIWGTLGLSLYLNEYLSSGVMGWNVNSGLTAFGWRFGIETLILYAQGFPIEAPPTGYMIVGQATSMIARGATKAYVYGMGAVNESTTWSAAMRYLAKHRIMVPYSVIGRQYVPSGNGMGRVAAHAIDSSSSIASIDGKLSDIITGSATRPPAGTCLGAVNITDKQRAFYGNVKDFLSGTGTIKLPDHFVQKGFSIDEIKKRWDIPGDVRVFSSPERHRVAIVSEVSDTIVVLKMKGSGNVYAEEIQKKMLSELADNGNDVVRVGLYDDLNGTPFARFVFKPLNRGNSYEERLPRSNTTRRYYISIDPAQEPNRVDRWFSKTNYKKLKENPFYNTVTRAYGLEEKMRQNLDSRVAKYLTKVGELGTDADKATSIMTWRGTFSTFEIMPFILGVKAMGAPMQDADPVRVASIYGADVAAAFLFTHRYIQNPLRLDGVLATNMGYATGAVLNGILLADFLPTKLDSMPSFDAPSGRISRWARATFSDGPLDDNFVTHMSMGNYERAYDVAWKSLSSTGLSGRFVELRRVTAYRNKIYKLADSANHSLIGVDLDDSLNPQEQLKELVRADPNREYTYAIALFNFADSILERGQRLSSLVGMNVQPDIGQVKLFVIDLSILRFIASQKGFDKVNRYMAEVDRVMKPFAEVIPDISYEHNMKNFVTNLNAETL